MNWEGMDEHSEELKEWLVKNHQIWRNTVAAINLATLEGISSWLDDTEKRASEAKE